MQMKTLESCELKFPNDLKPQSKYCIVTMRQVHNTYSISIDRVTSRLQEYNIKLEKHLYHTDLYKFKQKTVNNAELTSNFETTQLNREERA